MSARASLLSDDRDATVTTSDTANGPELAFLKEDQAANAKSDDAASSSSSSSSRGDVKAAAALTIASSLSRNSTSAPFRPTKPLGPDVVVLRDVCKRYVLPGRSEDVMALRSINLTPASEAASPPEPDRPLDHIGPIRAGEFVMIRGPSGGGKTTLLNMLGTIDEPSSGTIEMFGHSIDARSTDRFLADLRLNKIGFVFQTFNLLATMSAFENVELPMIMRGKLSASESRARALQLLDLVGLQDRYGHLPSELSGGEQQRCVSSSTLLATPNGGSILAGAVTRETQLLGHDLELLKILALERGIDQSMYRIEYHLGDGTASSHTVTGDHLVTLRCGQSPSVEVGPPDQHGLAHLNLRWWDRATLTPVSATVRYLAEGGQKGLAAQLPDEKHESTPLCPLVLSKDEARDFGFQWLEALERAGLCSPLRLGEFVEIRADRLQAHLALSEQHRLHLTLPMVPLPTATAARQSDAKLAAAATVAADACSSGQAEDGPSPPTSGVGVPIAHAELTARINKGLPNWHQLVDEFRWARGKAADHETGDQEEEKKSIPISVASGHSSLPLLDELLTLLGDAPNASSVMQLVVRVGDEYEYTALAGALRADFPSPPPDVKVVYMLHDSPVSHGKLGGKGQKSVALERLEAIWTQMKLTPEELAGVLVAQLSPLASHDHLDSSLPPRFDQACAAAMRAALLAEPESIVAFGKWGRECWQAHALQVHGVQKTTMHYDHRARPVMTITFANDISGRTYEVRVALSPQPSLSLGVEDFVAAVAQAHGREPTALLPTNPLSARIERVIEVEGGEYTSIAVSGSSRRFVLGDGCVSHNCSIARALSNEPELLLLDEPTGDLHLESSIAVMDLLLDLNLGKLASSTTDRPITIVMVTHNPDLECYADRILYVEDGAFKKQAVNRKQRRIDYQLYAKYINEHH